MSLHRRGTRVKKTSLKCERVLGLCGKVLVAGGVTGVASVRNCQKLPLCLIEPMPAGSKRDPLLAKAEPISNGGRSTGITQLRREKNLRNSICNWREE